MLSLKLSLLNDLHAEHSPAYLGCSLLPVNKLQLPELHVLSLLLYVDYLVLCMWNQQCIS